MKSLAYYTKLREVKSWERKDFVFISSIPIILQFKLKGKY